jgi:hypothetical protein
MIEDMTVRGFGEKRQNSIAAIRTDLDSFNDAEAFALMTSGYLMTREGLPQALPSAGRVARVIGANLLHTRSNQMNIMKDAQGHSTRAMTINFSVTWPK